MAEIITMEKKKILNFKDNKIQTLTLDELASTVKEEDYNQKPIMGMYHFDYIQKALEEVTRRGLSYKMEPVWAAQNQDKARPGVSVIDSQREKYGDGDVRSFLLRRIFSRIEILDLEDTMTSTAIALSFNQNGFQLAFGPNVKVCQNLSIMGADKFMTTYASDNKMPEPKRMIEVLGQWLGDFQEVRRRDQHMIEVFQGEIVRDHEVMEIIGDLTARRIRRENNQFPSEPLPPLNQGQIGKFTLNYLSNKAKENDKTFSVWDIYNFATELYKPDGTDFPLILSSNHAMSQYLMNRYSLN